MGRPNCPLIFSFVHLFSRRRKISSPHSGLPKVQSTQCQPYRECLGSIRSIIIIIIIVIVIMIMIIMINMIIIIITGKPCKYVKREQQYAEYKRLCTKHASGIIPIKTMTIKTFFFKNITSSYILIE